MVMFWADAFSTIYVLLSVLYFYCILRYDMHEYFPILQSWSPFLPDINVARGEIGGNTSRKDHLFDPLVS
jgi:hypothetical protein